MVRKSVNVFGDVYWRTCIVFWTTYPPTNRMPTLKQKMDAIGHSSTGSIWLLDVFVWLTQCVCGGGAERECVRLCVCVCVCVCVRERERKRERERERERVCTRVCVGRGRNREICHYPLVYFALLTCLQKLTCINCVDEYLLTCHWH